MARSITVIPAKQTMIPEEGELILCKKRVAAYCRVSTDQEEQLSSYENQVNHYKDMISKNPEYELVDIYADEGISGTSLNHRDEFIRLINDCKEGKIDLDDHDNFLNVFTTTKDRHSFQNIDNFFNKVINKNKKKEKIKE